MFSGPVAMIRLEETSSSAGAFAWAIDAEGRVASTDTIKSEARKEGVLEKGMAAIGVSDNSGRRNLLLRSVLAP